MCLCPSKSFGGGDTDMLAIVGTVPNKSFPLTEGIAKYKNKKIYIKDKNVFVERGVGALIAASLKVKEVLDKFEAYAFLIGDIGTGEGSKVLYEHVAKKISEMNFKCVVFHYIQPDIDLHYKVLFSIQKAKPRPKVVADAGFMYVAKMSGEAEEYDLFTPDKGELAFLADEDAPHPFYTRGFILGNNHIPSLIQRAYKHKNASKFLLVKGDVDYVASKQGILYTIDSPKHEAMEAIGGTGDTLTGLVSALIASGLSEEKSCVLAAKANRIAGFLANPTPATQISDIILHIPKAIKESIKIN